MNESDVSLVGSDSEGFGLYAHSVGIYDDGTLEFYDRTEESSHVWHITEQHQVLITRKTTSC